MLCRGKTTAADFSPSVTILQIENMHHSLISHCFTTFCLPLLSGWLISVNQLKLVGTHSAVSRQKLLHWRPTSWHIFHQNSNNIFTSDVWFYYWPATWAALDTISHFSESGPDSWPIWVAVVLPGPVLLHEVYVLQSDVVEVGERHDGRRGDAVGCVWGAERKKKRCQRGRIISGLLTLYIQ